MSVAVVVAVVFFVSVNSIMVVKVHGFIVFYITLIYIPH